MTGRQRSRSRGRAGGANGEGGARMRSTRSFRAMRNESDDDSDSESSSGSNGTEEGTSEDEEEREREDLSRETDMRRKRRKETMRAMRRRRRQLSTCLSSVGRALSMTKRILEFPLRFAFRVTIPSPFIPLSKRMSSPVIDNSASTNTEVKTRNESNLTSGASSSSPSSSSNPNHSSNTVTTAGNDTVESETGKRGAGMVFLALVICLLWLSLGLFYMLLWLTGLGCQIGISPTLMGVTFGAMGTTTPDAYMSFLVARGGHGEMAGMVGGLKTSFFLLTSSFLFLLIL